MRTKPFTILTISCLLLILFTPSCKEENDNPFDEAAIQAYEAMIAVQEESDEVLAGFETTMDSAAAVEALAAWFRGQENVAWAKVSSQGISVSYTNGMYGGIMIDPERYETGSGISSSPRHQKPELPAPLKNLPTYKKARCVNAAMDEFWD
ncbi:MAG: hypothetical protein MUC31_03470, partial [Bacteroidales bacterium]|nr:hypothetical protein [Bacteroidales bacterium]